MGPPSLDFVVGRYADDRIIDTRNYAGAHGNIGCCDVRCNHGYGPAATNIFVEGGEHNSRPCRSATPEKMSRKRISPGQVVNGACGSRKRSRGLIAVEFNTSKIKDIEHFNLNILGDAIGAADEVECLRNRICGGLVARANGGVHDGHERFLLSQERGLLRLGSAVREQGSVVTRLRLVHR